MTQRWRQRLHPDVFKLGVVSFLTDVSSEMIFAVFAVFFTTVAGASSSLLGLIEGLTDFSASSLNYLAGWLSDRSGRRKWFATLGYAFSTVAKLILLVSSSIVGLSIPQYFQRADVWAVYPSRLSVSAKVKVCVEFLEQWFEQSGINEHS